MTNHDVHQIAMRQLAIDLNCGVSDLQGPDTKVVISKPGPHYNFCKMICFRNTLVVSVDESLKAFIDSFVADKIGFRCLEHVSLLTDEFRKYDKRVGIVEGYLPDMTANRETHPDFDVSVLWGDGTAALFDDKRYHCALGYRTTGPRADVIAVAGYRDGQILGVAGASNDYETMWQIGIDVLPEHRHSGVATTLTNILTDEILRKGIVPFCTIAWSNIASKNTAIDSGYKSAWATLGAGDE